MRKLLVTLIIGLLLSGCSFPGLTSTQTISPAELSTESIIETEVPLASVAQEAVPPQSEAAEGLPSPSLVPTETPLPETPPGIILFIGDGMGTNHRTAATWLGVGEGGVLAMDNMPVHGLALTASASDEITDSAAAATAMATGHLTNNLYLGVDTDQNLLVSILELAQNQGWSVGLVTTTQLVHATPAAFAAHRPDRGDTTIIAQQIFEKKVDVLLGGGEDYFFGTNVEGCFPGMGKQANGLDLVARAEEEGVTYICSAEQLNNLDTAQTDRLLGLFAAEGMVAPYSPNLAEMTQAAIEILSRDPDGFFLMVEAGQIDWASHEHEAQAAIQNTLGLDAAVSLAQLYALDHPQTLIIVTADHETGGMTVNQDGAGSLRQDGPFRMPDGTPFWVDWALSTGHTGQAVTVTAQGPFAENLAGENSLTAIFETMTLQLFSQN